VLGATLALAWVWLDYCEGSVGREIKTLMTRKAELQKRYLSEEYKWTRLKAPASLQAALCRAGVAMAFPRRHQVVRMTDVPAYETGMARLNRRGLESYPGPRVIMND
jgi:hypothetical protein